MLKRNIAPYENFKTDQVGGKFIIEGDIGEGATVDCRNCELEIRGNRADNVTLHSIGKPKITGSKGDNVTYYVYDKTGKCTMHRYGIEGSLVIGAHGSGRIITSANSSSVTGTKLERRDYADEKPAANNRESSSNSNANYTVYHTPSITHGSITITPVGGAIKVAQGGRVSAQSGIFGSLHHFFSGSPAVSSNINHSDETSVKNNRR